MVLADESVALTEYQQGMLSLGETAVAALVFGLTLMVFLLTVQTIRHI